MDCAPHFQYIQTLLEIVPISEATPFFLSCSTVIWQTVVAIIYNSRKGPVDDLINWRHLQLVTEGCLLIVVIPRYRRVSQSNGDLGRLVRINLLGTTEGRSKIHKNWPEGTISSFKRPCCILCQYITSHISVAWIQVLWGGGGIFNPQPNWILFCWHIIFVLIITRTMSSCECYWQQCIYINMKTCFHLLREYSGQTNDDESFFLFINSMYVLKNKCFILSSIKI